MTHPDDITDAFLDGVETARATLAERLAQLAEVSPDVQRADARARARFKHTAGCICTSLDDGQIYLAADCKVHGRDIHPENWENR